MLHKLIFYTLKLTFLKATHLATILNITNWIHFYEKMSLWPILNGRPNIIQYVYE